MCVFLSVFSPRFLYHFFLRIHPDTARKNETKLTLCILAHHLSYAPSLFYSRGHHRRPWASTNLDPFSNHPFLFKEWAKPCWNRSEYPAANPHLKNGTTLSLWKKSFKFYSLPVNTVRMCIFYTYVLRIQPQLQYLYTNAFSAKAGINTLHSRLFDNFLRQK